MSSFFDGLPEVEPSSLTGYAGNRIDRRSENRGTDSVATALGDKAARVYLFAGDPALVKAGNDPLFTVAEATTLGADPDKMVLLGWEAEAPRLAAQLPETTPLDETRMAAVGLRALAMEERLSPAHLGALAQARSLLNWHNRHGFCSVCGAATAITIGGYRRDCPVCGSQHFPRTDPVVIMLAIDESDGGRGRCSAARTASRPACSRASPALSNRARRSRTRFAARLSRNPASASAGCAISPASRGRSRPR